MNTEKIKSFEEAAKPLIKWMAENVHPHHSAIVTCTDAELLMSECVVKTEEFTRELMAKGVEMFAEYLGRNEFAKESSMAYRFVDRIREGINDAQ